ncbi:hypothetical protein H6G33_10620 [Calothrix sp. FACHB-1219]|uniref:hypothetical protein n=1 Tax=unclassified Calothrix TaxID=2619626 RepID=UPI001689CAEA|nr:MULTISPECIES: hypothetical protein [unclassified Calothrix]MBD2201801.1 hypothetical protein [Calothrix sp. FACHB-168]MBD2217487.1 hypothetical protein [Calothrix sp. FACHB-1219]
MGINSNETNPVNEPKVSVNLGSLSEEDTTDLLVSISNDILTNTQLRATPIDVTSNNGSPITGQSLESGGSGLIGWLSSISKKLADYLVNLTNGNQLTKITDGTNTTQITNTTPGSSDYALITRNIPSGTQAVSQSGTWNITNVSGTVSLPTGAATESTVSAINNKLSTNSVGLIISGGDTAGITNSGRVLTVQSAGIGSPSQPITGSVSATQSGTWNTDSVLKDSTGNELFSVDLDNTGGTSKVLGVTLRQLSNGTPVEVGSSANPMRVDPTGTTTQPVSINSLPLSQGLSTSDFRELLTAEKQIVFSCPSCYGTSSIRDIVSITGNPSASVTEINGEIVLTTTTTGTDRIILETVQSSVYVCGKEAEFSVSVRVPALPVGNQVFEWGLLNSQNGMYFGVDSTSYYVGTRKNSISTIVRRSSWNIDTLDGNGSSGINLDDYTNIGLIWIGQFSWQASGGVLYIISIPTSTGLVNVPVHYTQPSTGGGLISTCELPITVDIRNGSTTTAGSLAVIGRQFCVYGQHDTNFRITSEFRTTAATTTNQYLPLIAWRKKSTFRGRANTVTAHPYNISISAVTRVHEIMLILETLNTITQTFGTPTNVPASETSLEVAKNSTINYVPSANALVLFRTNIPIGTTNNIIDFLPTESFLFNLPTNREIVLVVRPIGGTGSVDCTFNMKELW